jgi:hypothetical protein
MIDAIAHSNGTRPSVARALLTTCAKNAIIGDFCINAKGNPTVAPVTILTANRPGALQQLDTTGTKVVDVIESPIG